MFERSFSLIPLALSALVSGSAYADVIQTSGAGSAVTGADVTADFEDPASLGASYTEDGVTFKRAGLTADNNGCGFAGCTSSFGLFEGNFFYGQGDGGFIEVLAPQGTAFSAVEFTHGFTSSAHDVVWQAFLRGSLVGSGAFGPVNAGVIGFADAQFDRLIFTSSDREAPNLADSTNNPSIDLFSAELTSTATAVPSGGALVLFAGGLAMLRWLRRF